LTDVYTKEKRSKLMAGIKSKNTKLETGFFKLLENNGLHHFIKHANIEGHPDIVFLNEKVAVFLDSEFWHGWGFPQNLPRTRRSFWNKKIKANIERDREVTSKLKAAGWYVLRFWQRDIKKDPEKIVDKIRRILRIVRATRTANIVAVDWFCGAGGITRGLNNAGIKVKKGVDIDGSARRTYIENNPGALFIEADIRNLSKKQIMNGIRLRPGQKLLFAACAPCQPFSSYNKKKNRKDKRRPLLVDFCAIVSRIKPDFLFIENVPGLRGKHGKGVFDKLEELLKANKYKIAEGIINAKNFGIPQNRRRLVLIASKGKLLKMPKGTHGDGKANPVTVREAIGRFPAIKAGSAFEAIPNHVTRTISLLNLERIRNTPRNGGGHKDWPQHLTLNCHKTRIGYGDVYGRMKWEAPAPTLTCKCTSLSNGRFVHPEQDRAISLREAAAIQTFEDDYIFYGGINAITRHIGNAVPVKLAEIFGRVFVETARKKRTKRHWRDK
jgi:DNA (cytosine-5)-methyltransferase 1